MSGVDVIVPCYRYGRFLRQCVESILAQPVDGLRVLIIDDASPDDSAAVGAALADQDARVTFRRHTGNLGAIATFNEGVEWAGATYSLLISADDYLLPGALRQSVDLMERHPDVTFTYGKVHWLYEGLPARRVRRVEEAGMRVIGGRTYIERNGARNPVPAPTAVVRTAVQKRLGGYRPELPHTADMEMWLRLAAHGSVGVIDACQAVYRRHPDAMSLRFLGRDWLPDLEQRKLAFDLFIAACGNRFEDAEALHGRLLQALSLHAVGFAGGAFNAGDIEISRRIAQFACGIWPPVQDTAQWRRFALKRRLGVTACRFLHSVRGLVRRPAEPVEPW